jgi:hypothetical protein
MEKQVEKQDKIGRGKPKGDVHTGNDSRKGQWLPEDSIEKEQICVGGEAQVDAEHEIVGFERHQDLSQTGDEEEMIFMHSRVEDKVRHESEHRIGDQALECFFLPRKHYQDQSVTKVEEHS